MTEWARQGRGAAAIVAALGFGMLYLAFRSGAGSTTPAPTDVFDKALYANVLVAVAVIVLKFVAGIAGLVIGLLEWSYARDAKAGLVPPPLPRPIPAVAYDGVRVPLLFIGTVIAISVLGEAMHAYYGEDGAPLLVRLAATGVPMLVATAIVLAGRQRAHEAGEGGPVPAGSAVVAGLRGFLVGTGASLVAGIVWSVVLLATGVKLGEQEIVTKVKEAPISDAFLVGFFGVVVAPFTEETMFRGLLFAPLRKHAGMWPAALSTAVLFAGFHGNVAAFGPLFALAVVLARTFDRTDSLVAPVVAHATFNATSLVFLFLLR